MNPTLQVTQTRHLLIDGRPLTGGRNGVTRFVEQLIQAWPVSPAFRTTLISNKPMVSNATLPAGIELYVDQSPATRLPGTIWMQLRAAKIAKILGATDFLGTQHVVPLGLSEHLNTGVIVHDLVFDLYPETMLPSNRLLSGYFAPRSIRSAQHIFCVSDTTLYDLESYFHRTLPNAAVSYAGMTTQALTAPEVPSPVTEQNAIRLLVVGSMEPRKNVARFLSIFLQLAQLDQNVRLDIVSGGGWGKVLDPALYQSVMTHPMIKIHHGISDAALDTLYREVDFLVFPSIYEGFGLPILEAVGKCHVIANDIPVFRELAAKIDGVDLLDFSVDEHEVVQRLAKLLDEVNRCPARIKPDYLKQFEWSTCANTIAAGMGLIEHAGTSAAAAMTV